MHSLMHPSVSCSASFSVINLPFFYLNSVQTPSLLPDAAWPFAVARDSRVTESGRTTISLSYTPEKCPDKAKERGMFTVVILFRVWTVLGY